MARIMLIKNASGRDAYSILKQIENKLIYRNKNIMLFTNVHIEEEKVVYGRKNKVRTDKYLCATAYGYNILGEFMGVYDEAQLYRLFDWYEPRIIFPQARRDYLNLELQMEKMKEKLDEITTPDIVKAIP